MASRTWNWSSSWRIDAGGFMASKSARYRFASAYRPLRTLMMTRKARASARSGSACTASSISFSACCWDWTATCSGSTPRPAVMLDTHAL